MTRASSRRLATPSASGSSSTPPTSFSAARLARGRASARRAQGDLRSAHGHDGVTVVDADKVALTGNKLQNKHACPLGLPGRPELGLVRGAPRQEPRARRREGNRGMLPKNSLGRQQLSKLKVYTGAEHPPPRSSPRRTPSTRSHSKRAAKVHRGERHYRLHKNYSTSPRPLRPSRPHAPSSAFPAPLLAAASRPSPRASGAGQRHHHGQRAHARGLLPNKLHQQLLDDPFTLLSLDRWVRRDRPHHRRRPVRPGRRASPRHRAFAQRHRRREQPTEPSRRPASSRATLRQGPQKAGLKKARKAPQYSKR